MSLLWFGPSVWKAFVIPFRTESVMNTDLAKTSWTRFDSYLYDPVIQVGEIVILIGVLAFTVLTRRAAVSGKDGAKTR